jgi:transcriptional regulator with XRE-family HTH domain
MNKERLRKIRLDHNLTQRAMAIALGVSLRTLQRWELGESAIRLSEVQVIARIVEQLEGEHATLLKLKYWN